MKILSFTYWDGVHDTSAALVCDGVIVAAAEEERFSRTQHDGRVPLRAIEYCLREAGISMAEVDRIAFPERPFRTGPDAKLADIDRSALWRLFRAGHLRARSLVHHWGLAAYLALPLPNPRSRQMNPIVAEGLGAVREAYGHLPPLRFYDHHLCHAATAYLTSGSNRSAVVTLDGRGDPYSTVTWDATGTTIRRDQCEPWCNSLGFFYRDCTRYLGFGDFAEGKTMGLSSYADPEDLSRQVASLFEVPEEGAWYRYRQPPNEARLGFPPRNGTPATDHPYPQLAAAAQGALERAIVRIALTSVRRARVGQLCLGGGVALNCAANGRLLTLDSLRDVWVFAASGDSGLSLGAALLSSQEAGELSPRRVDRAYFGPQFENDAIETALLAEPRIEFHRSRSIEDEVAASLASGQVTGWFQGRMELGPRALGNRSILADPRTSDARDRVNYLKGREPWRPLAPSLPADRATELFELQQESPFMLFAAASKPEARRSIPAVVHVDGTARPQTVRPDQNPSFHRLLLAFERRTGVPAVLNTSFNLAGEPIVCTPADAIRTFLNAGLDALACGPFVARRRSS